MNIFGDDSKEILQAMNTFGVNFILIGGYAVNYHGYNRYTGDMDIWLKPSNENKTKLLEALSFLHFDENGIAIINQWDFTKPQLFHIGKEPEKTEFLTYITGVKYESAKQQSIKASIDGLSINVIALHQLIENKKASARLKDLADAEHLEKILKLRKT